MAIFAISDLHLSFHSDKPMDVFGARWENYENRMQENWNRIVGPDDLVIIPGDISWGMYLDETLQDLSYIHHLNGEKLLLRGNHDYWWTTLSKMEAFVLENGFDTIHFLKNTAFLWGNTAICGTRGWTIATENATSEDKKIYERERQRLILSLEDARALHPEEILVALHYPPFEKEENAGFLDILKNYPVKKCIFGHLHGAPAHLSAPQGEIQGIHLQLVSCDYLNFTPLLIKK